MAKFITYGSEYAYNSSAVWHTFITMLDSTHFVATYQDQGDSYYGKAVIGTISGGSISYGSAYTFSNTSSTQYPSVSKIDSTHFVIAFVDRGSNTYYGTAIVGTVSSVNQIAFGSKYVFNSATTDFTDVSVLDSTHFVVAYKDSANSSYGTAIIGTISNGNEIAYGSEYAFNSGTTEDISVETIDSSHFVVSYRDNSNSSYGTAIIGTVVSVNQVSYGSEYVFNSGTTLYTSVSLLDSTHFVVSFRDASNSNYGTSMVGTIASVNQISYGSEYVFNPGNTSYIYVASLDSSTFVVNYEDNGNSSYGTSAVGSISNVNEITYSSEYVFANMVTEFPNLSKIDSSNFVTSYSGASSYGTVIIGNVASEILTPSFYESVTVSESISSLIPKLVPSKFEAVTLSENISLLIPELVPSKFESVTVSENITLLLPKLFVNVFDSVAVSESSAVIKEGNFFDSITVSENISIVIPKLVPNKFDSVTVSENVSLKIALPVSKFESITVSENVSIVVKNLLLSTYESVSVSDVIDEHANQGDILDIINVSESVTLTLKKYGYQMPLSRPLGGL